MSGVVAYVISWTEEDLGAFFDVLATIADELDEEEDDDDEGSC